MALRLRSTILISFAVLAFCVSAAAQTLPTETNLHASLNTPEPAIKPPVSITPELRGDIYMARKMYREAIDMYRQLPDSPLSANKIGIAFHQMMQFQLAKKNYEHAIKLNPKYGEAINNMGTVFYAMKSYRKAIVYYKRSMRYSHPNAALYANLGAAYFARKDYTRASEYYEEALKLDPEVFEHRSGFGTFMQERTVTELATFHLYLAKSYAKRGDNARALNYLRKALEEGVKDRAKIPQIPEFAQLKLEPEFKQLLIENPKPL